MICLFYGKYTNQSKQKIIDIFNIKNVEGGKKIEIQIY